MTAVAGEAANADAAPSPRSPRRISWAAVLCVGIYAVVALAACWPTWPGDPSRFVDCRCGDPSEAAWFLAWTPHALLHGINPFFTTAINHPAGINLAANTGMPLLGLVTAPLTLAVGPVASLNLLMWLAYPLSASAMLFVLRRWTTWYPAAFAGGLLYGFSPYVVGQGHLHLQLMFVPIPPLIALAAYELFVRRKGDPRRWGLVLGLLAAAQLVVSTEVLATTFVVGVIGLAVLALGRPRDVRASVGAALPGIGVAVAVFALVAAYPAWMLLAGPQRYRVPEWVMNALSGRSGLLGPLAPTSSMRFSPSGLSRLGRSSPDFGDIVENGSYLGIPLLLLVTYLVVRFRRSGWLRFVAGMALLTFVLTLGPHLDLGGHATSVALPFALIERLPLFGLITPIRMALFVAMFVSMALALGLDRLRADRARRTGARGAAGTGAVSARRWPVPAEALLVALLLAGAAVSLLPAWPIRTVATGVPPYFTSPAVDRIPAGSTVLTYPYPVPGATQAMLWQAVAGMRFDLPGGYALNPGPQGYASQFPAQLRPADVQRLFYGAQGVVPTTAGAPPLRASSPGLADDVRRFLRRYDIDTVLVARHAPRSALIAGVVDRAVGRAPDRSGQVDAWYDVQRHLGGGGRAP